MSSTIKKLGILATVLFITSARARAEAETASGSPIDAVAEKIASLRSQGNDVTALERELEALRPGWATIQELQRQIQTNVENFRPRMEKLAAAVGKAGARNANGAGDGETGGDPIAQLLGSLDQLERHGKDVSGLRAELKALAPTWASIEKSQHELQDPAAPDREGRTRALEAMASELGPKVQSLALKVQSLASSSP